MKIIDLFENKKTVISFEIFPPKQDAPLDKIYNLLEHFKLLNPDYISVTYGAGGNTRGRTIEIAEKLKYKYNIESMVHLTCVNHTEQQIENLLVLIKEKGLKNILALRGDPPKNQPGYDFTKNYYKHAYELIQHIKQRYSFCIAAAAYVEGHVESRRLSDDLAHLKNKVDTGVDFLITQFFFDNRLFYDFLDKLASVNINCPVAAGIMPVFNADRIKEIAAKSGCSIPAKLVLLMDKYRLSPDDMLKAGIEYAAGQIRDLIDNRVDGIHIYTMNRYDSTRDILEQAGILQVYA